MLFLVIVDYCFAQTILFVILLLFTVYCLLSIVYLFFIVYCFFYCLLFFSLFISLWSDNIVVIVQKLLTWEVLR
jgi:hypothetical protein